MKTVYNIMFWSSAILFIICLINSDFDKMKSAAVFIWIAKLGFELEKIKEKINKPMPKKQKIL
jgi:hypothetical protein